MKLPTLREFYEHAVSALKAKSIPQPNFEAQLLGQHFLNIEPSGWMKYLDKELTETENLNLVDALKRRSNLEPMAYILGEQGFWKDIFKVDASCLIPRPDTETLIELATEVFHQRKDDPLKILDYGCGSGCIGLSLLREFPNAQAELIDISPDSVKVAKKNAKLLDLKEQCTIHVTDGFDFLKRPQGHYDLIISNPPYISLNDSQVAQDVKEHEPSQALFAPHNGYAHYQLFSQHAADSLNPKGHLIFEIGIGMESEIRKIFDETPNLWSFHTKKEDLAGTVRALGFNRV